MQIAVKCISCNWEGNAEVGRRKGGGPLSEQRCPKCGSGVRRRPGRSIWCDELAEVKREGQPKEQSHFGPKIASEGDQI